MKFFTSLSLTINLLLIFTQPSSSLFSMEKEDHEGVSWHSAEPKKRHRRQRSTSAFSRSTENHFDEELLSVSPPKIIPDRRSNSSPEIRKASSCITRKICNPEENTTERTRADTDDIMKKLEHVRIKNQSPDQTKKVEKIIENFNKPSRLKRILKNSRFFSCINLCGKNGKPPIHRAIESSQVDALKALLAAGANINAQDNKLNTPLHQLIEIYNEGSEWHNMYIQFLEHKEKLAPDIRNFKGKTALYAAIISGGYDQVSLLIDLNADVTVPTTLKENSTPIALLRSLELKNASDIVELLIEHGAKDTGESRKEKFERPKTRNRTKSREAIATLRKHVQSERFPQDVTEALKTLLKEHHNEFENSEETSDEELGIYRELKPTTITREVSTDNLSNIKRREFAIRSTEHKNGKLKKKYDPMPIDPMPTVSNPMRTQLDTRPGTPTRHRGPTVFSPFPISPDYPTCKEKKCEDHENSSEESAESWREETATV